MEKMHLEFPEEKHRKAYADLMAEWEAERKTASPWKLFYGESFDAFLQEIQADQFPRENTTPAHLYFLVESGVEKILGAVQLRHNIEHPVLKAGGGHIGYGIRPSERRKGYATEILRLCLIQAKDIGLSSILISCSSDNIASEKVILKNGWVYESTVLIPEITDQIVKRFWIHL